VQRSKKEGDWNWHKKVTQNLNSRVKKKKDNGAEGQHKTKANTKNNSLFALTQDPLHGHRGSAVTVGTSRAQNAQGHAT